MEIKVEAKITVDDVVISEEEIKIEDGKEMVSQLAEIAIDKLHDKCSKVLTEYIQSIP